MLDPRKYTYEVIREDRVDRSLSALAAAEQGHGIGLDIETAKLPQYKNDKRADLCPYRSRIRLIQLASLALGKVFVFDLAFTSVEVRRHIFELLETYQLYAHNALFEAQHLLHAGCSKLDLHCTMIMYMQYVRSKHSKSKMFQNSLQSVTSHLLKFTIAKDEQTSNWSRKELTHSQLEYAALDASLCLTIGMVLRPNLEQLMPLAYKLNMDCIVPVARMMNNGMYFSAKRHLPRIKEWEATHRKAEKKLNRIFGGINLNSGPQLSAWIAENVTKKELSGWPKTATGKYASNQEALAAYAHLPGIKELSEHKKYSKLLSTYGQPLIDKINPVTGRLHSYYTIAFTDTERMSSRDPNLQNLPRDSEEHEDRSFRSNFRAQRKDYVLVGGDYHQIEMKLAALLSGDPKMLDVYRVGGDIYKRVAAALFGVAEKDVSKEQRQMAKPVMLGLIYGMGAAALQRNFKTNSGIDLPLETAKAFTTKIRRLFSGFTDWHHRQYTAAQASMRTKTALGMVRKLNEDNAYSCSVNTPIQGTAGEIMRLALLLVDRMLQRKRLDARTVNVVHDELLCESHKECAKQVAVLMKKAMSRAFVRVIPDLKGIPPDFVEVKIGKAWREIK